MNQHLFSNRTGSRTNSVFQNVRQFAMPPALRRHDYEVGTED
jgi:hypothetical protein